MAVAGSGYTSKSGNGGVASVVIPSTVKAGDVGVFAVIRGAQEAITAPSGFTQLGSLVQLPGVTVAVFQRTLIAGDAGTTASFPLTSSGKWQVFFYSGTGVSGADPARALGATVTTSANATATPKAPSLGGAVAGDALIELAVTKRDGGNTWTVPAGFNARAAEQGDTLTGALSGSLASKGLTAGGTVGGDTWTLATAAQSIILGLVLRQGAPINPAPPTPAPTYRDESFETGNAGDAVSPGNSFFGEVQGTLVVSQDHAVAAEKSARATGLGYGRVLFPVATGSRSDRFYLWIDKAPAAAVSLLENRAGFIFFGNPRDRLV